MLAPRSWITRCSVIDADFILKSDSTRRCYFLYHYYVPIYDLCYEMDFLYKIVVSFYRSFSILFQTTRAKHV